MEKAQKRKKYIIVGIAILGVFLLIISSLDFSSGSDNKTGAHFLYDEYEEALEKKLEDFCRHIEGIENVKAFVTLDVSSEVVYAQNSSATSAGSTYEYLLYGSDEALPIYEITPKIRGIALVCDRGNEVQIQMLLTELIGCATGVASNKIKVVGYG